MGKKIYTILPYAIVLTLLLVIAGQIYWNYKNYQNSIREMEIDLQESFNSSVERYLTIRAEESRVEANDLEELEKLIKERLKNEKQQPIPIDSLSSNKIKLISIFNTLSAGKDTIVDKTSGVRTSFSTISITIDEEDFNLERLDSVFALDLKSKNLQPDYRLVHLQDYDTVSTSGVRDFPYEIQADAGLLKQDNDILLRYDGLRPGAISRGLVGMVISLILVLVVAMALLYLYRIIRRQKQLDEMKNDLISNITHEFKTPLATASAAVEGVQSFTDDSDPTRRKKYLDITQEQLSKLNLMVEKLLETAAISRSGLSLQREPIQLDDLLSGLVQRFRSVTDKKIELEANAASLNADPVHMENAIANLIDNAIKYGGNRIDLILEKEDDRCRIHIQDSGSTLIKADRERIFEKFYRAGSGNRHDVKGHGLGLYYTRAVIENHGGSIVLSSLKPTKFTIKLPL